METALGLLVFITILLFGIHFAELGFLSLKVNEAASFSIWESTGRRVHEYSMASAANDPDLAYRPYDQLVSATQQMARSRYQDFDGRESQNGSSRVVYALTAANGLTVDCEADRQVGFEIPTTSRQERYFDNVSRQIHAYYQDVGGTSCRASAQIGTFQVPFSFFDRGGGNFRVDHWRSGPLRICGAGRAVNGVCKGRYGILLGDWALDGPEQDRINDSARWDPDPNDNSPYRKMIERLYVENGRSRGRAASNFAVVLGGLGRDGQVNRSPHDESDYQMSYAGWEYGYVDRTIEGPKPRNTSGVYDPPGGGRVERGRCFLGKPCP